jgi:hypothetical protein
MVGVDSHRVGSYPLMGEMLARYCAIVIGAPLYMVLAVGPVNVVEKEWVDARAQLDKELGSSRVAIVF